MRAKTRSGAQKLITLWGAMAALGVTACAVRKTDDSSRSDSGSISAPAPTPVPASGANAARPNAGSAASTAPGGSVTSAESGKKSNSQASRAAKATRPPGGERDSVGQPLYEIGSDGKIHKR